MHMYSHPIHGRSLEILKATEVSTPDFKAKYPAKLEFPEGRRVVRIKTLFMGGVGIFSGTTFTNHMEKPYEQLTLNITALDKPKIGSLEFRLFNPCQIP